MTARNRGGKTAQSLTWNSEGRLATLVEGSSTSSYLYTADGDRLIRNQGGVKTLYLPGQELTYTSSTKPYTAVRYYRFAGTTLARRTTSAAETATTLINDPAGHVDGRGRIEDEHAQATALRSVRQRTRQDRRDLAR